VQELKDIIFKEMVDQHFDCIAVGVVDFDKSSFESFEYKEKEGFLETESYFDLASLTKPLTLASSWLLTPEIFTEEMIWLLNHRASLPAWGLLDRATWREQIQSYPVSFASNDLYSDFSALRTMLEIEKQTGKPLYETCSKAWDSEVCHWTDLKEPQLSPPTGTRNGHTVRGEVHDPNAWVIKEKISHAGLFGTISGLCRTLLNFEKQTKMRERIKKEFENHNPSRRFIMGWDRVLNPGDSIAGNTASELTFGHLGFTGTSIWMDLKTSKGVVLLSNGTKNYWYDKKGLNAIRRQIHDKVW
jgi:CubicO group peptidase (beta-lactamase class C family)